MPQFVVTRKSLKYEGTVYQRGERVTVPRGRLAHQLEDQGLVVPADDVVVASPPTMQEPKPLFVCPKCNQGLPSEAGLKIHLGRVHKEE